MCTQRDTGVVTHQTLVKFEKAEVYEEETTLSTQETIHDGAQRQYLGDYS